MTCASFDLRDCPARLQSRLRATAHDQADQWATLGDVVLGRGPNAATVVERALDVAACGILRRVRYQNGALEISVWSRFQIRSGHAPLGDRAQLGKSFDNGRNWE